MLVKNPVITRSYVNKFAAKMCRVNLAVWFACKPCNVFFAQVDDFIEHKKESHFTEFQVQNRSSFVFEERTECDFDIESGSVETKPIILKEEFQLANDSRIEINSECKINIVSCFDDQKLPCQIADNVTIQTNEYICGDLEPVEDTLELKTELTEVVTYESQSQEKITLAVGSFQPQQNPYVLVKRLTSKEIQDAISASNRKLNLNKDPKMHSVSRSRPFKCLLPTCGKGFTTIYALNIHKKRHSNTRPFCCPKCNKAFKFRRYVVEHLRMHTGERPYKCPVDNCGKSFAKSTTFSRHKKTVHRINLVKWTPIILEGEFQLGNHSRFGTNDDPNLPVQIVNISDQPNEYICGDSESPSNDILVPQTELFTYDDQIQETEASSIASFQPEHIRHALLKPPTSNEILTKGASSSTKPKLNLNNHPTTHFVLMPFKCTQLDCGKTFNSKRILWKHMKCHSNLKPFGCPHCDKTFKFRHRLVEHVRVHTGERPYKCPVNNCDKSYAKTQSLWRHKRSVHYYES